MSKSSFRVRHGRDRTTIRKKNSNGYAIARRRGALSRLVTEMGQLEQENNISKEPVDLSKDRKYQRIKKEISNLKAKI